MHFAGAGRLHRSFAANGAAQDDKVRETARRRAQGAILSTPTTTQPSTGSDWELHSRQDQELVKGLGLTSATMLVMGSMIGSGIFIVSAEIGREAGSPALL